MLYREDADGLIVISQPAHAWVSGQLARVWGNERFGAVEPRDDVCLGAEQHDLGWVEWEQAPTVHPRTGWPRRFFEMTTAAHVAIWRGASRRALTQGRYAALLVSLHVSNLYERHDYSRDTPEEAQAARDFLTGEREFQGELLASLRADPAYTPHATPAAIQRNQRLVAVWDRLSLALAGGIKSGQSIENVPTAEGAITLSLAPTDEAARHVVVAPWPFCQSAVTVRCDARRLPASAFADDNGLRQALARATWHSLAVELASS